MNNKGIAPLLIVLSVFSFLVLGFLTLSYFSSSENSVLASFSERIAQVTGRRSSVIPDLVVEDDYEFNIYPRNASDITNPDKDSFEMIVEISGPGAKKIADHYNNYGVRGKGFLLHSYYPMIGTSRETFPEINTSSLFFREVKESSKPTIYRADFYMGYLHKKAEFAFLKDIKKSRIFPPLFRVEGNSIVRDLPKVTELNFINSDSKRIGFGIKLSGDDAYQKAKEIMKDQIEVELTNGQKRKVNIVLRPDTTRKAYWGIAGVTGEVKAISFAKPYYFEITYNQQVPTNNQIRDWYLDSNWMTISRNIAAPSEELVTVNVSYASSCPRFLFNSKTKCNLRFEFVGNASQIAKISESIKNGQVKAYNLRNFSVPRPNTGDVVLDSSVTFVEGRKFTRQGKNGIMVNINGVSSSLRYIDFKDTGLKFNFFKVPVNFQVDSSGGVTNLTKLK